MSHHNPRADSPIGKNVAASTRRRTLPSCARRRCTSRERAALIVLQRRARRVVHARNDIVAFTRVEP
jgi:hypothetical protein